MGEEECTSLLIGRTEEYLYVEAEVQSMNNLVIDGMYMATSDSYIRGCYFSGSLAFRE